MPTHQHLQPCAWTCPWKGTAMCAQCLLNKQAMVDGRVTLGVLCGIKRLYQPHSLPPCIHGTVVNMVGPRGGVMEAVAA